MSYLLYVNKDEDHLVKLLIGRVALLEGFSTREKKILLNLREKVTKAKSKIKIVQDERKAKGKL